jgi:ketol-acid reductoisomerase
VARGCFACGTPVEPVLVRWHVVTADQKAAMDKVYADVAAGKFANDFLAINKKAFNF